MKSSAIILLVLSGSALADSPLTGEEFEAETYGKTITFSDSLGPFGAEQYLNNRRVFWSNLDGDCISGHWHPSGSEICFTYESELEPQCWEFFRGSQGLWAEYKNDDTGFRLWESERNDKPLYCKGPDVGS